MVSEVHLKFKKFATNLAISLRSCQSNRELRNESSRRPMLGGSSLQEKFTPFGVVTLERELECLMIS